MPNITAEYVDHMGSDLTVVNAARVSFDARSDWEFAQHPTEPMEIVASLSSKDAKLVNYLAREEHSGCFEHCTLTVKLDVPIYVARQIMRHRTFAYNEVSRRYVDTTPEFYTPDKWRKRADNVKQGSSDEEVTKIPSLRYDDEARHDVRASVAVIRADALNLYESMIHAQVAPELARGELPQSMMTSFYMTGNLRNWAHFLKLRREGHAQKEVQIVAEQVYEIAFQLFPESLDALMAWDYKSMYKAVCEQLNISPTMRIEDMVSKIKEILNAGTN